MTWQSKGLTLSMAFLIFFSSLNFQVTYILISMGIFWRAPSLIKVGMSVCCLSTSLLRVLNHVGLEAGLSPCIEEREEGLLDVGRTGSGAILRLFCAGMHRSLAFCVSSRLLW